MLADIAGHGTNLRHSGMRRQAQARNPFLPAFMWQYGFRVRSLHSRPGMTMRLDKHFGAYEVICPSCQLVAGTLTCAVGQITATSFGRPAPSRGALRGRHERWVRDAMDAWLCEDDAHRCGRRSRVVLTPRRWCQAGRDASASWLAMVATKPGSPGRARRKPLKPFARGKLDRSGRTCGDYARVFFILHARLRVLAKHPAFPAPSLDGGQFPQNSGDQRREIADARFSPLEKITSECAYV